MLKDTRPWGKWELILKTKKMWVKKITVNPGHKLSLQYHLNRKECWTIVKGYGIMTLELATFAVREGYQINIPYRAQHRIHNTGNKKLVFIEVALGRPDEDDIIRLQDDYGR